LIYLALLLRNVVRRLLQNIDHVKMLYVNLRNLFHCYFFLFLCCFLLYFLFSAFHHIMMDKDVYIRLVVKPLRRSGMDHTVLLANNTMLAFTA